jgi:nucleotide-binding universal stress UspA family protein
MNLKEGNMDKKIAILVRAGLPFRKPVFYGVERARETGAKLVLIGVVPDLDTSRMVALSIHEFGSYDVISGRLEHETREFLERVVQFCLDNGITVETRIEKGGIEEIVTQVVKDRSVKLVVVPTPKTAEHHSEFLDAITHFAHELIDNELRCPVVSVLAT